ncbi:MAG: 4-hydroxythreonine-4-phosphate dehydrogenase PdxA [Selenomonadales bacterium]|jgi:4-hydroxythreonine-4-phosphate dehydrogenase|nr:4-hydroxythreonine-4-phosphate dehydrogenase PdxA [Selenomonadales bacterium]
MKQGKPIIGITMGDPGSIGPEISVKALRDSAIYEKCRPIIIGDVPVMQKALEIVGSNDLNVNSVSDVSSARFKHGIIDVFDMGAISMDKVDIGRFTAANGAASYRYVEKAITLALSGDIDATVTNALSKEAINLAGHVYAGHTEIYAHLTGTTQYAMMLAHDDLRVVHVSTHVSLREACERVKEHRVYEVIVLADRACRTLGIKRPAVGVAGLNPHSGEAGMFGTEEIDEIIPAIERARKEGISVEGPIPPDTIFPKARGGWYDIVVAMYHDQGHIPLKMEGFVYNRVEKKWDAVSGINVTLGLPIIRTSVDHGTAMDIAYKGTASPSSLVAAISCAVKFAENRNAP